MKRLTRFVYAIDWVMFASVLMLVFFGLITMKSIGSPSAGGPAGGGTIDGDYFFWRQIIWLLVALGVYGTALMIDWTFFKTNSIFLVLLYVIGVLLLSVLLLLGRAVRGAESWIQFGVISVEPAEPMKILLILLLAKYFSRRHIEIARIQTLIVSALYVGIPAFLIFLQPDFGSAAVFVFLWLGMALVGGIRMRHLLFLSALAIAGALVLWFAILLPYQKTRIVSFLDPQHDARGAGYHALQSMIAVGSGKLLGRGIGFGTQSRLSFLPEHETDFIFAAFAEEWGLVGVLFLFFFFGVILWRVIRFGIYGESNFEKLYAAGLALVLFFQASIHIGMNIGVFPITGLGMPLVSYGGSLLVTTLFALGIAQSLALHQKGVFVGTEERYQEGVMGA